MYQFHFGRIIFEQLLKLRRKLRTVPSLEFTEYRDGDRRILRPLKSGSLCIYVADKIQQDNFYGLILPTGSKQSLATRANFNLINMRADFDGVR